MLYVELKYYEDKRLFWMSKSYEPYFIFVVQKMNFVAKIEERIGKDNFNSKKNRCINGERQL